MPCPLTTPTGGDGTHLPAPDSSETESQQTDTLKTTVTGGSDYSTLGRLRKNINELDSLIYELEESQQEIETRASEVREVEERKVREIQTKEVRQTTAREVRETRETEVTGTETHDVSVVSEAQEVAIVSPSEDTTTATEDVPRVSDVAPIAKEIPIEETPPAADKSPPEKPSPVEVPASSQATLPESVDTAVSLTLAAAEASSSSSQTTQVTRTKRTIETHSSQQKVLKQDESKCVFCDGDSALLPVCAGDTVCW